MQNHLQSQHSSLGYLKSLALASGLSLFVLTGCQTTTGLSQSGTSVSGSSTPATESSTDIDDSSAYEEVFEEAPSGTNTRQTDNPFEPDTAAGTSNSSPVPDQSNTETNTQRGQTTDQSQTLGTQPIIRPSPTNQKSAKQILLEQARQNSAQANRSTAASEDGDNIPAFRKLMNTGVSQLRQGQVAAAQSTFTRAQRLAPQSSAVYYYLGQVALAQNQPLKTEAMARRGLVVAKTTSRKQALWRLILKAGQAQGNARVINEAKAALAR